MQPDQATPTPPSSSSNPLPTPLPEEMPAVLPLKKKSSLLAMLLFLIVVALLAGGVYGGYVWGTRMHKAETPAEESAEMATVALPKDATVTAECVTGRGKQYIVPKDIPDGPIYDVNNGTVIAVEYLVHFDEVNKTPEKFSNLTLGNGTYDHMAVLPMEAHAGVTGTHVHVVDYLISATAAAAIKCDSTSTTTTSTDTMDMSHH